MFHSVSFIFFKNNFVPNVCIFYQVDSVAEVVERRSSASDLVNSLDDLLGAFLVVFLAPRGMRVEILILEMICT